MSGEWGFLYFLKMGLKQNYFLRLCRSSRLLSTAFRCDNEILRSGSTLSTYVKLIKLHVSALIKEPF